MCLFFFIQGELMEDEKPSFLDVIKSVLASFFGVQSDKNRRRDFQQGNPGQFILVGINAYDIFYFNSFRGC